MAPQEEPQYAPSDVIAVLDRITEMIEAGRSVPFSASVMINQAEGVELLENARAAYRLTWLTQIESSPMPIKC